MRNNTRCATTRASAVSARTLTSLRKESHLLWVDNKYHDNCYEITRGAELSLLSVSAVVGDFLDDMNQFLDVAQTPGQRAYRAEET